MKNALKDKKEIDRLFATGKSVSNGIIAIKWVESSDSKILFAVSSSTFKRAVDRNRIKRLMRESVKGLTFNNKSIAIIYREKTIKSFNEVKDSIIKLSEKI